MYAPCVYRLRTQCIYNKDGCKWRTFTFIQHTKGAPVEHFCTEPQNTVNHNIFVLLLSIQIIFSASFTLCSFELYSIMKLVWKMFTMACKWLSETRAHCIKWTKYSYIKEAKPKYKHVHIILRFIFLSKCKIRILPVKNNSFDKSASERKNGTFCNEIHLTKITHKISSTLLK